ncbi:hypothetical protein NKH73_21985 [Mesorhizobium sp. M0938]|uniref:hypothetical protein n=1 Tax=unclassified Mesorhizobium TaxID=325217 RepID=UPI0033376E39
MLQAASPLPGAGESLLHLCGPSACIRGHQLRSCGLVLGHSPKPCGSRELFERRTFSLHCSVELVIGDEEIADTALASRCFYVPHLSN